MTTNPRCVFLPCQGAALLLAAALASVAGLAAARAGSPVPAPVTTGYLQGSAVPDSLALSPSPPAARSATAAVDEAVAAQALALRGSARFQQARLDAAVDFPEGADQFSCALGISVDATRTPALHRLLERSLIDASASTKAAKARYQRARPFMVNGEPTCTPEEEQALRGSGSYPSGHTAIGWAWALILAEAAPERATALLERGHSYGQSRLVCNVHWYSDVQEGRTLAAATVAQLHGNAEFRADLDAARHEIARARADGARPARDCGAETTALQTRLSEAR
ncbi:acid phosphatase [Stenotrophomonas mori]|uniref:Acid phosphatase n=1 Tax=Stenotrophomonas mori TaxID=2871096 RepID=A0ABT0SI86_9GAMM|nr:phosphatase PAP2 family protein [Stenotrophomonas mori]MCL7714793.1 phosphatase PAP2 family protein [Stenotrophomonas mori]